LGITRLPATTKVTTLAATALLALAVTGAVVSGTSTDTVPPDFGNVPPCHIEALASNAEASVFTCSTPAVSDATTVAPGASTTGITPTPTLPSELSDGQHTLKWSGANAPADNTRVALPKGTHKVTWTATDGAGNKATTTQVILVTDTKPPVFKGVETETEAEATATLTRLTADVGGFTVSDEGGTPYTLTASVESMEVDDSRPVLWTARDNDGNVSRLRQEITIIDETAPTIGPFLSKTIEITGQSVVITPELAEIKVTDNSDPDPVLTASPSRLEVGTHDVTWFATDMYLNVSSRVTQSITIVSK